MPTAKRGADTVLCTSTRSSSTCTRRRKPRTITTPMTAGSTANARVVSCCAIVASFSSEFSSIAPASTAPITPAAMRMSIVRRIVTITSSAMPLVTAAVAYLPTSCSGRMATRSNEIAAPSPARNSQNIHSGNWSPLTRVTTSVVTMATSSTTQASAAGSGLGYVPFAQYDANQPRP
jgi:hypothetical protein